MCGLGSLGIIHRSICAENVLLTEAGHVLLTDLHRATYAGSVPIDTPVEDPSYQAPEVLLGWRHDAKVDVWSFGVLMYVMLVGKVRTESQTRATFADGLFVYAASVPG